MRLACSHQRLLGGLLNRSAGGETPCFPEHSGPLVTLEESAGGTLGQAQHQSKPTAAKQIHAPKKQIMPHAEEKKEQVRRRASKETTYYLQFYAEKATVFWAAQCALFWCLHEEWARWLSSVRPARRKTLPRRWIEHDTTSVATEGNHTTCLLQASVWEVRAVTLSLALHQKWERTLAFS